MSEDSKSLTPYEKDQASISQEVISQSDREAKAISRTTIRLQLTRRELWLCLALTQNLGGKIEGKSYRTIIQRLLKSLLASRIKDHTIEDISDVEALKRLEAFQEDSMNDPGAIEFESLEELAQIEKETREAQKGKVAEALRTVVQEEQTEGLQDLFPNLGG